MRYIIALLLLVTAPTFAWVECDPDAISADRFDMSNLLENGNSINVWEPGVHGWVEV